MMFESLKFNGEKVKRTAGRPENIPEIYESILRQQGIHVKPMTKLAFDTCYARYKKLGGTMKFYFNG